MTEGGRLWRGTVVGAPLAWLVLFFALPFLIVLGISIVPFQSVERETRGGSLRVARIRGQQLVRETGWVYRSGERVPRVVQEMMATLTRIAPTLPSSVDRAS